MICITRDYSRVYNIIRKERKGDHIILYPGKVLLKLPQWLTGKESTCQCRRCGFDPWVRKIPWRRKWQPTPVFLPGKSHEQRSLAV